jgi:CRP-like cAMP-binding protein
LERSTALGWTPADAQRLIQEHPIVASNALSGLGSRMLGLNARLREIHTEPADRRIARALLRLAGRVGTDSRAGIRLSGTTLHTASRTVSRWARDGILKGGRKRIMIADLPGLEAMVAED